MKTLVSDTDAVADYEGWAIAMCSLLDRIEMVSDDEDAVRKLTKGRFEIAARHGFTVVFSGQGAGYVQ